MKKFLKLMLCLVLILSLASCYALAEGWPQGPVTLTVSAGAGGGTDICARRLLEKLADFGSFVVQNDTDGAGAVGWERVKNVDPATCSELIFYNTGLYTSYLTGLTDINPVEDLIPVCCLPSGASQFVCVPKESPFNTIQELVDYALAHPGELKCGVELGSLSHIYVGLVAKSLGIEWSYVSTGSDNDRITLLMGNNIDVTTINQATTQNYYESGDIKVLACEQDRDPNMSEKMLAVPTLEESGFSKVEVNTELIVWAPKGGSDETYAAIFNAFKTAISDPDIQAALLAGGSNYYCPFESWEECYENSKKNLDLMLETCKELGLVA